MCEQLGLELTRAESVIKYSCKGGFYETILLQVHFEWFCYSVHFTGLDFVGSPVNDIHTSLPVNDIQDSSPVNGIHDSLFAVSD